MRKILYTFAIILLIVFLVFLGEFAFGCIRGGMPTWIECVLRNSRNF